MSSVLVIAAVLAAVLVVLSFFPDLSWPVRFRITAGILTGVVLIGFLGWPIIKPAGPFGIVMMHSLSRVPLVMLLVFGVGFLSYFITWPDGMCIGAISVPSGLSVWAMRSAPMSEIIRNAGSVQQRLSVYRSLIAESFIWLIIVGVGFSGVYLAHLLIGKVSTQEKADVVRLKKFDFFNLVIGVFGSVIIAFIIISVLAQDIKMADINLGWVIAQPANGQIAFAVFIAFAGAAFIIRRILGLSYVWAIAAIPFLYSCGILLFARRAVIEHLAENWPAVFYAGCLGPILPIQMVSFGTFGAMAGYWIFTSYKLWLASEHHHKP